LIIDQIIDQIISRDELLHMSNTDYKVLTVVGNKCDQLTNKLIRNF